MKPKVDMSNLARIMLEWEMLRRRADALQIEIESTVMEIGKTQNVGNVRASYSGGRKVYDYLYAAGIHPEISEDIMQSFTITPPPRTNWRGICEHLAIPKDDILFTQSPPSVTVKLLAE